MVSYGGGLLEGVHVCVCMKHGCVRTIRCESEGMAREQVCMRSGRAGITRADSERGLHHLIGETAPDDGRAEAAIHQRLVQRASLGTRETTDDQQSATAKSSPVSCRGAAVLRRMLRGVCRRRQTDKAPKTLARLPIAAKSPEAGKHNGNEFLPLLLRVSIRTSRRAHQRVVQQPHRQLILHGRSLAAQYPTHARHAAAGRVALRVSLRRHVCGSGVDGCRGGAC